ncbi:MAG TPA: NUDIX hydrolase [Acholeplasmataceae bacterium]|nr:NUDIX hydrolase [Acholeplasmataceae bacterium]
MKEKQIKSEYVFEGKIIKVRRDIVTLPNNKEGVREVVEHSGSCAILAIDGDEIIFVRQFRYPYGEELLEVPAGKIDKNEKPIEAAIRELREETGAVCENIFSLGKIYPSPGFCNEVIFLFYTNKFTIGESSLDKDEFIKIKKIKFDDALQMILEGKIVDAKTICAIYKYKEEIKK